MGLKTIPLESDAFAEFGFVIAQDGREGSSVNQGRAIRLDDFGALMHTAPAVRPIISLYAISASQLPLNIALMERHPLSSQVFVPMEPCRSLIVVAPTASDGNPDPDQALAFIGSPGQGFCYHPGTWHAPLFALGSSGRFSMMMWDSGTPRDCEEYVLPAPLSVGPV